MYNTQFFYNTQICFKHVFRKMFYNYYNANNNYYCQYILYSQLQFFLALLHHNGSSPYNAESKCNNTVKAVFVISITDIH